LSDTPIISVVDDDDSMRAFLCSLVRSLGFRANAFASAEEFLQSSTLGDASCVISDVRMPDMNGIELQSALNTRGYRVPIIFVTAFPDEATEARAMRAGAVCFLSKPFEGDDMIKCLEKALRGDRPGILDN
jgi:FixJ family two-component response regulator